MYIYRRIICTHIIDHAFRNSNLHLGDQVNGVNGVNGISGHDGKQLAMHMAMHSYYLQKDGQWIDSGKWSLSKS